MEHTKLFMQQQICTPEQINNQQAQQVMLCPVRVVYETQILVQPGEQIQPNQTLFINPQNPPPWIQNRPQNQVIYMQQLPNNIVPSVPQHIDQNQFYIQNYAYPQQIISQMDQMRQMPNVMTQSMMGIPNIGQNIGANIGQGQSIAQNVHNTGQNVMPITNIVQNVQKINQNVGVNISQNVANDRVYANNILANNTVSLANNQNTVANVNTTVMADRTAQMNQNLVNMQKVAELQGMRQQTQNARQPQVTVSPMQNVKLGHNVNERQTINTRPQMTNVINNTLPNMQANVMAKNKVPVPNKVNATNVIPNQVRHYNQTYYRPIQPRPMSVMPIVQNQYLPMQTGNLNLPRPQNQMLNIDNRKRKSESPDETRKKIPNTANNVNNQVPTLLNVNNQLVNVVHSDIGVNTNPVHRDVKLVKVETTSTGTQANIVREKPQVEAQKAMEIKMVPTNLVKENVSVNVQTDSDKLVRNTVFTQARGLIRTETPMTQPDIISIERIENIIPAATKPVTVEKMIVDSPVNAMEVIKKDLVPKLEINETIEKDIKTNVKEALVKKIEKKEATNTVKEEKPIKIDSIKAEVKIDTVETTKIETIEPKLEKIEAKEVKEVKEVNKQFTVTAISDFKGNEVQITDGSVRKENTDSYILTHVLDGYVIQESNTAFPIRKPLKEKTIYQNTDLGTEQKKEEVYKHRTEDGKLIKDNSKILSISDLNLSEDDKVDGEVENSEEKIDDQPFANLKPAAIKSWTVDQLATHLSKYKWTETISVLLEHEIDGESLFLVSKPQLVQIGVSEEHADVICEFIKK